MGGPASHRVFSHSLNFTAMKSTQSSSGTSRKGFFWSWDWIFSLFSLGHCFWPLVSYCLVEFFPTLRRKLLLYTCNGDKSQKPCSASVLAYLAGCSSRQIYWTQLQVMDGREIYGLPWLAKIVTQWPTGLSWGNFRLSQSHKLFTLSSALQPHMFPDEQLTGNYDLSWWAQCTEILDCCVSYTPCALI